MLKENIPSEEQLGVEAAASSRAWKPVLGIVILLSMAALFKTRYQDVIKMAIWTTIFAGLVMTYTWPFIMDALSRVVVAVLLLLHIPVMLLIYPRVPHHGYTVIALVIAAEYVACLVPIAWLDLRSQRLREHPTE